MALDFSKFGTPVEQSSALDFSKFGTPAQPPEKQSAFRQIADVPLGIAKGAVQGVRMIADAFGAGSDTSKTIKSAETYLADLMSAQAKNDQQEIARIMKDAEDKGVLDQVKAGIKAFTVAPIDTLSSALGTAAPVIAGALGAKVLGAGALLTTGVSALTGAGMGAGTIKGSIYEETKKTLKEAGASEQDAEARAKLAQEYGGKNLDQILLGTVLGGAAAVGPLEKGGAAILARRILGKTGTEATETVAGQAAKGAVRRRLEAGALEAVPEAIQAGQEQVAQNIALQREGFDVPTFRGAVSSATLEGLAGAGLGAAVGGGKPAPEAPPPEAPPPPPALEYKPEPFIQFPDGTVAKRSEVETYIKTLPEDQQMAMRAKLLGLAPQEAETPPAEPTKALEYKPEPLIVYPDGSVARSGEVETYIQGLPEDEQVAARAKLLGMGEVATEVTPEILKNLGIRSRAPIIQRLSGLELTDPKVTEELTNFAAQPYASPEVRGNIFGFLNTIKPVEAPAPKVAPTAPETPVAATQPTILSAPAAPDRAKVQSTLNTLEDGDTIVTDDGDRVVASKVIRNKNGDVTAIVTPKVDEEGFTGIDFYGLASFVTPQPYIDSTTGERKFTSPATIEKAAAPAASAPAAPAPAAPKFEPQIVSRQSAPDGMEVHVFSTTDGYGTGLFDADANQYVNGSVTRFAGEDTLPKAEARAAEMLQKATPVEPVAPVTSAAAPKAEALKPAVAPPAELEQTPEEKAQQIRDLKDQQTKLLTKSGKIPAPRSPARQKYNALAAQIADLEGTQLTVRSQKPRKRPSTIMGSPMLAGVFNYLGGLHTSLLPEFSTRFFTKRLDKKGRPIIQMRNPMVSGYGTLFNKNGKVDFGEIAEYLEQEGYLEPGSVERDYKDAGERAKDLIRKAINREEVLPIQDQIDKDEAERQESERQKALERQEENRLIATGEMELDPEFEWNDQEFEKNLGLDREFEYNLEVYDLEPKDLEFLSDEELEKELTDAEREQAQARRTQKTEADAARQKAEGVAPGEAETFTLTKQTAEELKAKQEAQEKAAAEEKKSKAAEQARLQKEQRAKEEKARADESVKDFELGKSAEEQMTGMGDLFAAPPVPPKREPRQGTQKQLETADKIAKEFGATVVYQDGDLALMRGFSRGNGQPNYMAINGLYYSDYDIESSRLPKNLITPEQKSLLIKIKQELEAEDKAKFDKQPSIKFVDGLATSANVSSELAGITRGWKELLGLKPNLYLTTIEDAVADRGKFTGPHRAIGSAGLDNREAGVVRRLPNGEYYIAFKKGTSKTKMLEVLAHELGHMHEIEVFQKADQATRQEILDEHSKWLKKQTGKTAREFVSALRAKTAGKTTKVGEGMMASEMTSYWTSFTEWYADQVSRWAVTSEKPVSVVEKFFSRLAQALKSFYSKLKNAGYLPNETFVQYLEKTHQPSGHVISTDDGTVQQMLGEVKPSGTPGQQAISIINALNMGVKPPEPGRAEKAMKMLKDAGENPSLTKESAKKTLTKWLDWFETTVFSSDSAFNNKIRRGIISDFKQNPEVLGMLLEASQSQTVHADALASQFMIDGGLQYNDDLKKWESVKKPDNFVALAKKIEDLAKKYNVTKDEMERIAHTYFVAKRLPGIIKRNEELDASIKAERATAKPDRKQIEEWESLKVFVSDEQLAMMDPGLSLVKTIPELKEVVDIWQGIRKNNIDVMVNSGLWSPEYATAMWDNMDYVPYYREEQLEEGAGPQEFIRGLQVKSKEFQLKGSGAAVNDVFDNMIRWSQYAMNRAIRAHKATQMIDAALKIEVDGKPMATKVTEQKRGMNIVRAFRDGKQELYDMADPLFVPAFSSIQNVSIPTLTFMSKVSNVLRQSVVLYPLFSVAQVPQDSFAAMFSSGLKTQHALKIPYLAVKEFIKTLSKTSATHNELTKYGVVGVRDFSATIIRNDAEIYAGLKPPKGGWGKTKEFLEHIAMAADNAVRQAVYEASMQQGLNKSEALEKAFEIINFRRRGTSKMLNVMGQTVPFFYAYLSAQRVAYRVISGVGISPSDRKEALTTLATTSAAVATLSMLYAMAVGDDEDYAETPAAIRDRTLTIPGSGGIRIPLRPDFFLLPKIVAEHTYLMLSDKGFEDGAKFRKSIADALLSAVASPTPFPTAIKPAIEVAINYDFFQGKPLIGNFEKQKDVERQFRDSTSELAKILSNVPLSYSLEKGKFEGLSPIAIDHMIRGMLGSFGGLLLFGTNQFLHSDPDVPRPELSAKEMLAALPGTSGLLKRPQESALKNDFYVLRDEVEKAANTFSDIKNRSPEGIQAFLEDEKNMARLGLAKGVDKINRELSKIRKVMTQITNMPESQMSGDEKSENIRQLRELEREILRSVNVKELREMAKI